MFSQLTLRRFSLLTLALSLPLFLLLYGSNALAHASEQAFVLLLPTNVYITSGVLVVVLTIVMLTFLPANWTHKLFTPKSLFSHSAIAPHFARRLEAADITSIVSTVLLFVLIFIGFTGTHDPLKNPLPLFIWTLWWIGFVVLQGLLGDLWRWVNPWTGVYKLMTNTNIAPIPWVFPLRLGHWLGVIVLLLFMMFALADIAPNSPTRLTLVVAAYWLITLLGVCRFGERWLQRAECFTMLLDRYAQLAPLGRHEEQTFIGFVGWRAHIKPAVSISSAVFILVLLGTGSFDGLNETFSWLAFIGINPLEYPGRSAVVGPTVVGLIAANLALIAIYAFCVFLGLRWANATTKADTKVEFIQAFCTLAISLLPIAFAYHFAHFLTAFLVNVQYALAAASDPLTTGQDLLGLGTFYVTTGFMNSHHSVQAIWLTQAAAVVAGHVLSVLLAHALALDLFGSARRAIISQAPLAAFMVGYTFIGLWLLAAPRGA